MMASKTSLDLDTCGLTKDEWSYVCEASKFVENNLDKPGPTICQRFQLFAALPERERYVHAIRGQRYVLRAGPIERGYDGDAVETIDDHASNMNYMNIRLLKYPEIARSVYRQEKDPIKERALVIKLTREHDCPETIMFDMSKTDAEKLPEGMKRELERLSIKVIFQSNANERRKMEKYADKHSTIDRHVKVVDGLESVVDAIAAKMIPEHFEEFLSTAQSIVAEYATPEMKLAYANKFIQGFTEYYYHADKSTLDGLEGKKLRRAIFDSVETMVLRKSHKCDSTFTI